MPTTPNALILGYPTERIETLTKIFWVAAGLVERGSRDWKDSYSSETDSCCHPLVAHRREN